MKKILITCGLAIAAIGYYSGAFGENKTYIQEARSTIAALNFQDTTPGKKRDTTNRKPMPKDTIHKDTLKSGLMVFAVK